MALFIYTALTKDGKTVNGTMEAANKELVIQSLVKQSLRPLTLHLDAGKKGFKFGGGGKKVKLKDLVVFTRQLSTMIGAGVALTRSLATMQSQTNSKYFKTVLAAVAKDVESGVALADALKKFPNVFSEVYINMVRAGETGGILDDILKRLALQVERDSSMRKKIKGAMAYPVAILGITVIAFFAITVLVMPKLGKIISDLSDGQGSLPIYTRLMLGFSSFMQHNIIFILIALFASIWFLRRYIKTPGGKYKFHDLLLRIPVIKTIIIKIAIARFSRTFASYEKFHQNIYYRDFLYRLLWNYFCATVSN